MSRRKSSTAGVPQGKEIVLAMGTEGGSITIVGRCKADQAWEFQVLRVDQTRALLDEADGGEPGFSVQSPWLPSWDDVLRDIGRWPWHWFTAIKVHPEFGQRVFDEVSRRWGPHPDRQGQSKLERWKDRCGVAE